MKKIISIFAIILFCISFYLLKPYFSVFYFQNDANRIAINIEAKKDLGEVFICFDKECDHIKNENDIYSYKLNQENPYFYKKHQNIELIFENKDIEKNIKQIAIFNGNKFEKITKFEIKTIDFSNKTKKTIVLPKIDNSKTIFQKLGVYIEGILHNWYFFGLLFLIFLSFKPKINEKLYLPIILGLNALLIFSHIDFIPLWNDELYNYTVISDCGKTFALNNIFHDPGNPPLFFLISNIWLKFLHNNIFEIRLLSAILGILLTFNIYHFANKIFNKKIALTSAFLASINLCIIMQANEIRCYILAMNLIIIGSYLFYKLIKNFNNKNLIHYTICATALVNLHFYCILYVAFNFIFGLFLTKNKIKFALSNLISFSTFGIYFLISYKNSLSSNFNTWIPRPTIDVLNDHIIFYFGNLIFFIGIIFFIVFIFKKLQKIQQIFILYSTSSICFIFVFCYLFSILIKPILFERYFVIFIPFLIITTAIFLNYNYQLKFKNLIVALILFVSINIPKYENFNLFSNIYTHMTYSIQDYKNYEKDYQVYFIIPDKINYANYYKEFSNIKKENLIVSNYGVKEFVDTIDFYINQSNSKSNKFLFYAPEITVNQMIIKKYNPQKLNTSILPIYKFFVIK